MLLDRQVELASDNWLKHLLHKLGVKSLFALLKAAMTGVAHPSVTAATVTDVLARQVHAVAQSMPTVVLSNSLILALIATVLWDDVPIGQLVAWLSVSVLIVAAIAVAKLRFNARRPTTGPQLRFWAWCFEAISTVRALALGAGTIAFFPVVSPSHQLVLGLTAAAMMCGGAFALAPMPVAAITFSGIIGMSSAVALLLIGTWEMTALAALTVIFFLFLWMMIFNHGRLFADQVLAEVKTLEQSQTIGVLLKEFEASTSDWLWRTDADGIFFDIGPRFAEAADIQAQMLAQMRFAELFQNDPEGINAVARGKAERREPLSAVTTSIRIGDERRYWSLSASPHFDSNGVFTGYRGVAADITGTYLADSRLRYLAHADQLTGLVNRARFAELLDDAFAQQPHETIGLITIDLNGFKSINDTLGHPVGDQLLAELGLRLKQWAPPHTVIARLGGDEFAVLLLNLERPEAANEAAAELLMLFSASFDVSPHRLTIGACAGVAIGGLHAAAPDELMKCSDLALYAAKSGDGSDRRTFDPQMANALMRRQHVERALHRAIDDGELSLLYQPIIELETGRVAAYEGLLRWTSAELGRVDPDEFIPVAEECGLIAPIGDWVLRHATLQAATFPTDVQISVNVSPTQMRDTRLLNSVIRCLDESGLSPRRLTIEITEGVFLESSDHVTNALRSLLDLGVEIALDDFGTGYSSLSYLLSFPFSKIKIDRSFVDGIESSFGKTQIVRAVMDLAKALGFKVVAEGVETGEQLSVLQELNCDLIQGYLFSPPQQAEDIRVRTDRSARYDVDVALAG